MLEDTNSLDGAHMLLVYFQVRETAAVTLSGLLHCGYMDMDKDMFVSYFLSVCLCLSVCSAFQASHAFYAPNFEEVEGVC